jgi:hypothetical protein
LVGHENTVRALAFSPDGETLASSGTFDGTVRLWSVKTGLERRRIKMGIPTPFRLVFSPDGRALAGGSQGGVARVWESFSGLLLRECTGHRGHVMGLAFSPDGRSLAAGNWMGVRLWDLATSKEKGELLGYQGDCMALAFSPDGKVLASGGGDTTTLLWKVSRVLRPEPAQRLTAEAVAANWTNLASTDGRKAFDAVWALSLAPAQAVPLLSKHLKPARPVDDKRLRKLIEDLGDEEFETRKRAMSELQGMGDLAEAAMRKALAASTDVDVRLRLQLLLGRLSSSMPDGEQLRELRALAVLERAATPAARRLLGDLARGAAEARLTGEARACLDRLARRQGKE